MTEISYFRPLQCSVHYTDTIPLNEWVRETEDRIRHFLYSNCPDFEGMVVSHQYCHERYRPDYIHGIDYTVSVPGPVMVQWALVHGDMTTQYMNEWLKAEVSNRGHDADLMLTLYRERLVRCIFGSKLSNDGNFEYL